LRRDILSFLLGRHEVLPSGKNTCRPARSSDRCTGENMERKPCNLQMTVTQTCIAHAYNPCNTRGSTSQPSHGGKGGVTFQSFSLAGTRSSLRGRKRVCWYGLQIYARREARNTNPTCRKMHRTCRERAKKEHEHKQKGPTHQHVLALGQSMLWQVWRGNTLYPSWSRLDAITARKDTSKPARSPDMHRDGSRGYNRRQNREDRSKKLDQV